MNRSATIWAVDGTTDSRALLVGILEDAGYQVQPIHSTEVRKQFPKTKALFMSGYSRDLIEQRVGLKSRIPLLQNPLSLADLRQTGRAVLDEPGWCL